MLNVSGALSCIAPGCSLALNPSEGFKQKMLAKILDGIVSGLDVGHALLQARQLCQSTEHDRRLAHVWICTGNSLVRFQD